MTGGALLRQVALLGLLIVTAGFWIYFSVAASGFTSDFNLFSLLRFAAIQITIGFAQMVALSIGDLNLAVGDRKSTRLNPVTLESRMPSSA